MFKHLQVSINDSKPTRSRWLEVVIGVSISVLCALIILSLFTEATAVANLQALAAASKEQSGVDNPVTAVLLNFRSYDTLLEVAVLLIVAILVLPDTSQSGPLTSQQPVVKSVSILEAFLRWLIPTIVVMAGYILWTGASLPGGAFQAGALLAGALILLLLGGKQQFNFNGLAARIFLTVGLTAFIAVALLVAIKTGAVLMYPVAAAGSLILLIEVGATITIASILFLLFYSFTNNGKDIVNSEVSSSLREETKL